MLFSARGAILALMHLVSEDHNQYESLQIQIRNTGIYRTLLNICCNAVPSGKVGTNEGAVTLR